MLKVIKNLAKEMPLTENIFRNLRFDYSHNTSKINNLHYHEFNEETPWKLYIPLVRSGGYRLTPNPGESPKEDMNSQLDLLHMNDEQVWSLTKVYIFYFGKFSARVLSVPLLPTIIHRGLFLFLFI